MPSSTKSKSGVRTKTYPFDNFQGLDSSRDITALDTGEDQHLAILQNATADWRGQIVRDPSAKQRTQGASVDHVRFFGLGEVCWAERTEGGINLKSERGHSLDQVYDTSAIISTTIFNRRVMITSAARPTYGYNGAQFERNQSRSLASLRPAFCLSIQRRVAVAGIPGRESIVELSRVDNEEIYSGDEEADEESVLRAGFIDVGNLLGTADQVTGLGTYERNRLVIFTADQALVYRIDPDINRWELDDSANINIGCISHNTIANAGTDLLFCSRSGVHSVKRSENNGLLVYSYSMSDKIDLLYRELFNSVPDKQSISAVFDQDEAQYHIFFPQPGGLYCRRLTLSLNPEGGQPQPKFSTGDFLNARCGAFLGGQLVVGTSGGVYDILKVEKSDDEAVTPEMEVVTPMLWHGDLDDTKQTYSIIIQASGKGVFIIDAVDDNGRVFDSLNIEVDDSKDDNRFTGVPLQRQYERQWSHRYRGAQYRIRSEGGGGLLRLIGFAITVAQ